ncbi:MAG: hypothetical protein JRI61_12050, partial [Deltaproteobacteria bacterium]|nr:hypothetical protein [Deltaproteobacteria bacterium]
MWKPKEIIIHESVREDPVTTHFLNQCDNIPAKYVSTGIASDIIKASEALRNSKKTMLNEIITGKQIVYIAPAKDVV